MGGERQGAKRPDPGADAILVYALRSGSASAQREFFERFWPRLRELCRVRLADRGLADEVAQDTLVKALKAIDSFRVGEPFWPWLSTIARRLCIDAGRSRRLRPHETLEAGGGSGGGGRRVPQQLIGADAAKEVGQALRSAALRSAFARGFATLSPRARRIIWLHDEEELGYAEIAEREGTTVDAVRNLAHRARCQLRAVLDDARRDGETLGLAPLLAWLRRWLDDCRQRARRLFGQINATWFETPLAERGLAFLTGMAMSLSLVLLGAAGNHSRVQEKVHAAPAVVVTSLRQSGDDPMADQSFTPRGEQGARVRAHGRIHRADDAVGPKHTSLGVVVFGPNGEPLLWRDTGLECGDGREWQSLPRDGPVRSTC